tara:strand:+ start:148 stop:306 length:159 start_codon:yes stop_codon:yes gene_type:complete
MVGLSEEIGKIVNLLEDAIEEKDWSSVQKCFDELEELYDKLERGDDFDYDYD